MSVTSQRSKMSKASSVRQKFSFRRRKKTDEDEDLLSLQSLELNEPLNPSPLHGKPQLGRSLLLKKARAASSRKSGDVDTKPTPRNRRFKKENRPPLQIETGAAISESAVDDDSSLGSSRRSRQMPPGSNSSRRLVPGSKRTASERKAAKQKQSEFDSIVQGAQALDNAANDLFAKGNYDEALSCYTRALKLKKRTLKFGVEPNSENAQNLLASVATSINNIGYLRQRAGGTTEEIMAAYQDSLQIKKEILGDKDLSVGKTLNNIGSVYFGTRKYEEAMTAYEEARVIMQENLGSYHLDVATVHSNIGDVLLAQRQLEPARSCYSNALKIRWNELGEHHVKVVRLLEKIAAIEMADSPEKMQRSIRITGEDGDEDPADEESYAPEIEMKALRQAVKDDVVFVEKVKREMALEMIRDKIQMIREMRDLEGRELEEPHPLTPEERSQALADIKERVECLRRRKESNERDAQGPPGTEHLQSPSSVRKSFSANLESKFEAAMHVSVDS